MMLLRRVFVLAAWFGLVAGILEGALFTILRLTPGGPTWLMSGRSVSLDFLWVAPLLNLGYFLLLAPGVTLMAWLLGKLRRVDDARPLQLAVLVFTALGAYVLATVPDRLHEWAAIALAVGVGVRVALAVDVNTPQGFARFSRSLRWLVATVALAAIVLRGGAAALELRARRGLAPAPPGAPNVLLIVLDTVRADHLSSYGYARPTTPHLDKFAREGVLFEWAISPAP